MIGRNYVYKKIITRLWKFSTAKESRKKIIPHGIFIFDFLWIDCKPAFIYLWIKNSRISGKGIFSRSEPLFFCPNPCYDSLGKASREKTVFRKNQNRCPFVESLQLDYLEILYYWNKIYIYNQTKLTLLSSVKVFSLLNSNFLSLFFQFKNLISKSLDLKSGIKFSGDFLIYKKKKKSFNFHNHSKAVFFMEDLNSKKRTCIYCHNSTIQLMDIQNRTRLGTQVSKFNVFSFIEPYYKTYFDKKSEDMIKREININRFILS